jgi:hypothetical protein
MYDNLDDVIEFPEIGASITLRDVYAGLELKPKLARKKVCSKCGMAPAFFHANQTTILAQTSRN